MQKLYLICWLKKFELQIMLILKVHIFQEKTAIYSFIVINFWFYFYTVKLKITEKIFFSQL